ncbi:MAG: ROK family glucokinase [Lachnospiraceae bacterium]|nr:ROK family glucokinase [Lachnospiraceae bacterium]
MSKYAFGIDVGGTSVKLGLLSVQGEILDKWEIPTRTEDGGKNILSDIAASVKEKIAEKGLETSDIAGAGIGLPGPVDDNGVINKAVNLHWDRVFNVSEELSSLLSGMKVKAGNDANVAALGEVWQGAGKGYREMVMVTLGTGVGGGLIHDGKIIAGSTGAGGEIGHIAIKTDETVACNCGNKGCLEQYASATGIVRLLREELEASDEDSIMRHTEISAKEMWEAVKKGDALATRVAERFGEYLGTGLSIIAGVLNPEVFVLGGGVSRSGDVILPFIEKNFRKHVFHACSGAKIVRATLGNDAGLVGAAKMVID